MIDQEALALACIVARVADDKQASDILVMEVGEVLKICEYFVVLRSFPNN